MMLDSFFPTMFDGSGQVQRLSMRQDAPSRKTEKGVGLHELLGPEDAFRLAWTCRLVQSRTAAAKSQPALQRFLPSPQNDLRTPDRSLMVR